VKNLVQFHFAFTSKGRTGIIRRRKKVLSLSNLPAISCPSSTSIRCVASLFTFCSFGRPREMEIGGRGCQLTVGGAAVVVVGCAQATHKQRTSAWRLDNSSELAGLAF